MNYFAEFVGNISVPKMYRAQSFMDMDFEAEPMGVDPITGFNVYFGEGHIIACLLEDKEDNTDMPF